MKKIAIPLNRIEQLSPDLRVKLQQAGLNPVFYDFTDKGDVIGFDEPVSKRSLAPILGVDEWMVDGPDRDGHFFIDTRGTDDDEDY